MPNAVAQRLAALFLLPLQLNSGLSQLQQQADQARRAGSSVRAHVDMLQQLVSPGKPGTMAGAGVQPAPAGHADEAESLLRVLQV